MQIVGACDSVFIMIRCIFMFGTGDIIIKRMSGKFFCVKFETMQKKRIANKLDW